MACAEGSYSSTAGATSCTVCPNGTTTAGTGKTTCDVACSNAAHVTSWTTPTWDATTNFVTNKCAVAGCNSGYAFEESGLPSGYTPVEYIQSGGSAYINTGIAPNDVVWYTTNTGSNYLSGARAASGSTILFAQSGSTTNSTVLGSVNGTSVTAQTNGTNWKRVSSGQKYHTVLTTNNGTYDYYIYDYTNDRTFTTTKTYTPLGNNISTPINIFALHSSNMSGGNVRIYSYRLVKSGTVVFNGIPAKNASNVAGLYDTVSEQFFTSATSTQLSAGQTTTAGAMPWQNACSLCSAGSFCLGGTDTGTECASGSYSAAGASACIACQNGVTTSGTGSTSCNATCANNNTDYIYAWTTAVWSNNSTANVCTVASCAQGSHLSVFSETSYANSCEECVGATYQATDGSVATACTACPNYYTYNTDNGKTAASQCQIECAGGSYVAAANDASCSNVGTAYWSAGEIVNYGSVGTRTACPTGLTTTGSGVGADEAGDCGRILHVGAYSVRLRSAQKTTPSLKFDTNNDGEADLFGSMTTTQTNMSSASNKKLKVNRGGTVYYVHDDTATAQ